MATKKETNNIEAEENVKKKTGTAKKTGTKKATKKSTSKKSEKSADAAVKMSVIKPLTAEEAADKTIEDFVTELVKKAGKTAKLSYDQVGSYVEAAELDKDQMDELYEELLKHDVEIIEEEQPNEFELDEIDK